MLKSLLIFTLLLVLLGIGTIWIIEKQTGTEIIPDSHAGIERISDTTPWYYTIKSGVIRQWNKLTGAKAKPPHFQSVSEDKPVPNQPEIVKWQDAQGVWHYEYKKHPPAEPKKHQ